MRHMSTSAITSDAIRWNAADDDHPARAASQRSYSAVAKGDLAEWLTVYAEDAVLEDPVGPSMFDEHGAGHHGHDGISAFWEKAIAPIASSSSTSPTPSPTRSNTCANIGRIRTSFADGSNTTTDLIMVYVVNDDGRVASMKAYWEPERTMASFRPAGGDPAASLSASVPLRPLDQRPGGPPVLAHLVDSSGVWMTGSKPSWRPAKIDLWRSSSMRGWSLS